MLSRGTMLGAPTTGGSINWSLPLARGLVFLMPFSEGSGVARDIVEDVRTTTNPVWVPSNRGQAAQTWSVSNDTLAHLQLTSGGFTIASYFRQKRTVTNGEYIGVFSKQVYVSSGNHQGWGIDIRPPDDTAPNKYVLTVMRNQNYLSGTAAGYFPAISQSNNSVGNHLLSGSLTGGASGTSQLWLDGRLERRNTGASNNPLSSTAAMIGASNNTILESYWCAVWNRVLLPDEQTQLWALGNGLLAHLTQPQQLFIMRTMAPPPPPSTSGARSSIIIAG